MPSTGDIASLLIFALSFAFVGWATVHIAALLERGRQERHAERWGKQVAKSAAPLPAWARLMRRWLLP